MPQKEIPEELKNANNMIDALGIAVKYYGDNVVQRYKDETKEPGEYKNQRTLKEYYKIVRELACGLILEGFKPGEHISILAENRAEWNLADHAILMIRCITVGIYTNDTVEVIEYKFEDTGSTGIVVEDKKQLDKVLAVPKDKAPNLRKIIVIDPKGVDTKVDDRVMLYDDLGKRGREADDGVKKELEDRIKAIDANDVLRLVYTSGTSGKPKGVMLTHYNLKSNVNSGGEAVEIAEGDVLISYMPESHSFQTFLSQCLILSGGCIAYAFRKTLISDLPLVQPTLFAGVQRVWAKIHSGLEAKISSGLPKLLSVLAPGFLAKMIKKKAGLANVRLFVSGAGKLEPYTFDFFKKVLGVDILLGYGLSETSPVISVNTPSNHRLGSSGLPVLDVIVKVVNADRKEVPVGTIGEIVAKGPNIFVGYYNKMDKYKEVVDGDGWFYTGDRGYVDEDGFVYCLGRAGHRVKFADGEHHDLEEIGSRVLGYTKLITQIAVYGEYKDFPVAVVSMTDEEDDLKRVAETLGVQYTTRNDFAYDPKVVEACKADFLQAVQTLRDKKEVQPMEDVKKALYIRPMSEDNSEKTPTQKTRLNLILQKYEPQILPLYESAENFVVHKCED